MKKTLTLLLAGVAAVAAVAAVVLAACGDDDGASKDLSIEASEPSANQVELSAPSEVQAGRVEIKVENEGRQPHNAQLIRVVGDHSRDEVVRVYQSTGEGAQIPEWFRAEGGSGTVRPGETRTVTQVLPPGKYFIFDDESAGEGEDAPDNYERGGLVEFEVTGDEGGDLPASAGPAIRAADYSFESFDLRAGRSKILVENTGRQPHHVVALPIREGNTIEDVEQALREEEGEPSGPPPFDEEAGVNTAVIDGGRKQIAELELRPGNYALLCFISDRQGGPPHVAKGMIAEATVR